jgi:excisionase family DNA binding protein
MAAARPETTSGKPRDRSDHAQVERLVYTVPEAGRLLGLSRNAAYEAAKRGDIPTLRIGRLLLVPKIALHRMLGITTAVSGTTTALGAEDAGA